MCSVNKSPAIFGRIHGFLIVFSQKEFLSFLRAEGSSAPSARSFNGPCLTSEGATSSGNGARGRARDLDRHLLVRRRSGNAYICLASPVSAFFMAVFAVRQLGETVTRT